jgi:diguanylate cyclase (GGDEF)-like protein
MLGAGDEETRADETHPLIHDDLVSAALLETLPPTCAVLAFDRDVRFVSVHGDALRAAGIGDEDIVGRAAADLLVGSRDAETLLAAYGEALSGGRRHLRLDRSQRSWDVDVGPLRDRGGAVVGGLVIGQDVTSRQQARRLHEARARAAALIATSSDDLAERLVREVAPLLACVSAHYWQPGFDGRLRSVADWVRDPSAPELAALEANSRASRLEPGEGVVGAAFATGRLQLITDLRRAPAAPWIDAALQAGALTASAIPALRDGRPVGVFEFFGPVPIEDDPDVAAALRALLDEVTNAWEQRRQMDDLRTLADHDGLTGLLNRRRFEEELARQAAAVSRYGRRAAVVVLDLDDFKSVNDRHGHAVGDAALRCVAEVLGHRLRASDRAGRLGGDEFAVILDGADAAVAARVAAELASDLAAARLSDHPDVRVSASVGTAEVTGDDGLAALHAADQAMYGAKRGRAA